MGESGWFPDPSRMHQMRFFDGARWTDSVSDAAISKTDPLPAPSRASRGRVTTIVAIAVVVVLVAAVGGLLILRQRDDKQVATPQPSASPPAATTSATPLPDQLPATGPGAIASEAPLSGRPPLKVVAPAVIRGPVFAGGESTYTMSFDGWPFAFRVPGTWGCLRGTVNLSGAKAWVCIDESHPTNRQKLNVMLRPCPTTCTAAEQAKMTTEWYNPGDRPVAKGANTTIVETARNAKGLYSLDMSHFFVGARSGTLHWQVGAYVESPAATQGNVQKIINEIRSQSGS